MSIRSLFFLAMLGFSLFTAPVRAQQNGCALPDWDLPIPWKSTRPDVSVVHFRVAHLREDQPFPLEAMLHAYLHRGDMKKLSTQDQLARIVELSYKTPVSLLPKVAEEQFGFSSAAPPSGFELALLLGEPSADPCYELCWRRCGLAASHHELELTYRRTLFETEDVRITLLLGFRWTDEGLGCRVSCLYEYYLGDGEALCGEAGGTWIFGDGPHLDARMFMCWWPVEEVELEVGYDLMRGRLWHGGTWQP